jgi:hypothetical protein
MEIRYCRKADGPPPEGSHLATILVVGEVISNLIITSSSVSVCYVPVQELGIATVSTPSPSPPTAWQASTGSIFIDDYSVATLPEIMTAHDYRGLHGSCGRRVGSTSWTNLAILVSICYSHTNSTSCWAAYQVARPPVSSKKRELQAEPRGQAGQGQGIGTGNVRLKVRVPVVHRKVSPPHYYAHYALSKSSVWYKAWCKQATPPPHLLRTNQTPSRDPSCATQEQQNTT